MEDAKHILLATSLRSLGVGAKVQSMLNRFGHCMSYHSSLELETALASQVIITQSPVPSNISVEQNAVSHVCWDNFDINEETPSGSGTTHTTHGIVVQKVNAQGYGSQDNADVPVQKTKQRSFQLIPPSLPICLSRKRAEPSIEASALSSTVTDFR